MKALLLGALLALTPVSAFAADAPQHLQIQTIHKPDPKAVEAMANVCSGLMTGDLKVQEVVDGLHLDTAAKQQALVDNCTMYMQGVEDVLDALKQAQSKDEPTA